MADRLGIDTHLHNLRHYSATELIAGGVDVRTVAGRLGHGGGGTTTLRVYAAWVAEADQRAAQGPADRLPERPAPLEVDEVERAKTDPRYPFEHIAVALRDRLAAGEWAVGAELPTGKQLGVEFDVSTATAQRAVTLLQAWELVEGQPRTSTSRSCSARVVAEAGDGQGPRGAPDDVSSTRGRRPRGSLRSGSTSMSPAWRTRPTDCPSRNPARSSSLAHARRSSSSRASPARRGTSSAPPPVSRRSGRPAGPPSQWPGRTRSDRSRHPRLTWTTSLVQASGPRSRSRVARADASVGASPLRSAIRTERASNSLARSVAPRRSASSARCPSVVAAAA